MVLGITHAVAGVFVGVILGHVYGLNTPLVLFAVLGALLPDIDHPASKLGRYFKSLRWFAKHRGFFHSLFAAVLFTILIHLANESIGYPALYAVAFLLGFLSHLVLDAWTKEGIQPFFPVTIRIKGKRKVGSPMEWLLSFVMVATIIFIVATP